MPGKWACAGGSQHRRRARPPPASASSELHLELQQQLQALQDQMQKQYQLLEGGLRSHSVQQEAALVRVEAALAKLDSRATKELQGEQAGESCQLLLISCRTCSRRLRLADHQNSRQRHVPSDHPVAVRRSESLFSTSSARMEMRRTRRESTARRSQLGSVASTPSSRRLCFSPMQQLQMSAVLGLLLKFLGVFSLAMPNFQVWLNNI